MSFYPGLLPYVVLLLVGIVVIVLGAVSRSNNRGLVIGSGIALAVYVVVSFAWSRISLGVITGTGQDAEFINMGVTFGLQLLHAVPVALLIWASVKRGRSAAAPTPPAPTWPASGPGGAPTGGRW